ncbi:hypothetical protein [Clostridium algidicarnis]|uniref:hypothetical protein n=1 Tax=Clostridium algidicarnis TaxID=37659 RepID=UPI001C0C1B40|nr:hypothetical protein [Clostridium algidicarnis]MBU3209811.1 hypothetical protein [Clostridium algidicarnis]MBU3228604.1 hypothetical protein [Clostridium algidicarnis]MBU3251919.1 hypothetical protein [Clostridium algidicarnis]
MYNTEVSIAFKNADNTITKIDTNIFELKQLDKKYLDGTIITNKNKKFLFISMKCPFCNKSHSYNYKLKEVLCKDLIIGGCKNSGDFILLIGKKEMVYSIIKECRHINNQIYSTI